MNASKHNQLIVLQPTPFCNIDCKYCYLPHRRNTQQMSLQTAHNIFSKAVAAPFKGVALDFVWHAGEPLTVPIDFYKRVFDDAMQLSLRSVKPIRQHFQTNAILLNSSWIELIRNYDVGVGLSIDGPRHIHDQNRVRRDQSGYPRQGLTGRKVASPKFYSIYKHLRFNARRIG
jgi:uncharacterized protein